MRTSDNAQEVYERWHERVFAYVLSRVRSRADAEDITSEVFLKLLAGAEDFDPDRVGASSYVFRAAQTAIADHYRKEHVLFTPLDDIAETLGDEPDAMLEALDHALGKLPEREAEIVMLHYYYGLSHREIAGRMRLSYANVRQLCHTALVRLRGELADV